jgi:hypothetical protein
LSVARLTHAIEFDFEAPLAQHALSPANAPDAVSIAAATRAIVVILIMVNPEMAVMAKPFKLFCDDLMLKIVVQPLRLPGWQPKRLPCSTFDCSGHNSL